MSGKINLIKAIPDEESLTKLRTSCSSLIPYGRAGLLSFSFIFPGLQSKINSGRGDQIVWPAGREKPGMFKRKKYYTIIMQLSIINDINFTYEL